MLLNRELAASCLQRTFRRMKEQRKIRSVIRDSTRPLYLRARHLGQSFRVKFRFPIAKSAILVIQSTWRRYSAYKEDKQRKLSAATTIQKFLRRGGFWRNGTIPYSERVSVGVTLQRGLSNVGYDVFTADKASPHLEGLRSFTCWSRFRLLQLSSDGIDASVRIIGASSLAY